MSTEVQVRPIIVFDGVCVLWFGRHEACMLPPAEHESRFLD